MEGEDPLSVQTFSLGRFGGSRDDILWQAGQIFRLLQDQHEPVVLLEDVLAELDREDGQFFIYLAKLGLLGFIKGGAAAHEGLVCQL